MTKQIDSMTTKTWSLGRAQQMRRNIANRWVEYTEPNDLLDQPSHMQIGLCWYQKDHESLWTYDLTDHIMVDLETIIALATITFIVESNLYEVHPMDAKVFNDYINDK